MSDETRSAEEAIERASVSTSYRHSCGCISACDASGDERWTSICDAHAEIAELREENERLRLIASAAFREQGMSTEEIEAALDAKEDE